MKNVVFLTLAEIIEIHNDQIENYGGGCGVRDMALLESAIAQPPGIFAGQWLHENIFMMDAAYAFHICNNHPFFDGNKRVALASALVFLEINGITIIDPKQKILEATLSMAQGQMNKNDFSTLLQSLVS